MIDKYIIVCLSLAAIVMMIGLLWLTNEREEREYYFKMKQLSMGKDVELREE